MCTHEGRTTEDTIPPVRRPPPPLAWTTSGANCMSRVSGRTTQTPARKPFWGVHGLHGILCFTLFSNCRGLRFSSRKDGYHSIFRLVFQYHKNVCCLPVRMVWPGQLPKGKEKTAGRLFWAGFACSFALRAGLDGTTGVASPEFTRGPTPTQKLHPKNPRINTETRAHKTTHTTHIQKLDYKIRNIHPTNTTNNTHADSNKTYEIHIRTKIQSVGRGSGQVHKDFC